MSNLSNEYIGTNVNKSSCYSNLNRYGSSSKSTPIIPPTLVTLEPAVLKLFKPHNLTDNQNNTNNTNKQKNCMPYKNLNTC